MRFEQIPLIGWLRRTTQKLTRVELKVPKRRVIKRVVKRVPAIDPKLREIWTRLSLQYFPENQILASYQISWSSRRQKRTLACCNIRKRMVVVAKEMNHPDLACWLEPLIYHEMCHAVLETNISRKNGKRLWHGPEFKQLEARHPESRALKTWVKSGGWAKAVRSHRARMRWERRVSLER